MRPRFSACCRPGTRSAEAGHDRQAIARVRYPVRMRAVRLLLT